MRSKLFLAMVIMLFLIAPLPAQEEETEPAAAAPSAITVSGAQNKISLDIKGMDVVDVLKMLATRSGMNIVVGKNVTGRVTLFLKDVDISDAFEIVILANDLAYEKKGEIYNVMTQRDYELLYGERYQDKKQAKVIKLKYAKAADLSRALNQIKTNIGRIVVDEGSNTLVLIDAPQNLKEMEDFIKTTDFPNQTRVFSLNYAQADELQAKIQEAITKGVGSVRIDERTNKIAVTDYPQKLDEIAKIVSAFDEKTQQVLIDAQIIEITPSDTFKMGVDWDYWIKENFRVTIPFAAGSTIGIGAPNTVSAVGQFKTIVDLLRTIGDTQILSSPRITAVNNQEAKILIGTKEVYVSQTTSQTGAGTAVTADQVTFLDVGIKLYVTPTINRDNFITMKIKPEISSVKSEYEYGTPTKKIPVVETSEAETTVIVRDGVTIIIGGLKKDKKAKTVNKIPILGDIPLIGFFFRNISNTLTKTELVILLTPHILTGDIPYTALEDIKPKDGAVAKMIKGDIVMEKIVKPPEASLRNTASEYYKLVADKVRMLALFERPKSERGEIKVSFTLSEDGNLAGEPSILQTSNSALEQFALRAVKDASPFLPFPSSLEKREETFKISLSYE